MSKARRAEKEGRILTEREVSDIRALHGVATSRQMLRLVERIVRDHTDLPTLPTHNTTT